MGEQFTTVLGSVPHDWEGKTIGELAIHVGSGITPTGGSDVYTDSGVTFIRSQNVTNDGLLLDDVAFIDKRTHDRMKGSEVFAFDVLLNITGASIGRCCYLPSGLGSANVNQHVCAIRLPTASKADAKYLASVLASPIGQNQIFRLNAGGNREGLNYQQLRVFRIPWPPRECRAGIARILTTVDNLIEKTEALIAKYQAIKQGIMHDLFTRGVDEHGHLRPPYEEAPELYKQSELGWIPKEWDCVTLGEVVPVAQYGISVSLDDSEGIPVLRMNNLGKGVIDATDIKRSQHPEARRLLLKDRDVLFNRTNSIDHVGRTSIWKSELPESSFASYLVRLVPNAARLMPEYLVFWMNRPEVQIAIRQFATPGVHQVNINPTNLRKSLIAVPSSLREQAVITRIVLQHEKQIGMEQLQLSKLSKQKTGLMQDLLTGKVRVKADEAEEVAAHA